MPYVYLDFLGELQKILGGIFKEVLGPVLKVVFNSLVSLLGKELWSLFSDILLDGFIILLKLINFLESMFNLFSGLAVVKVTVGGQEQNTSLLSYVFGLSGVSRALFGITVLATVMAFLFALYATGKSISDVTLDESAAPITTVLRNGFKSAITFMVIPFTCMFLLQMSSAVLDQVVLAFDGVQQESGGAAGAGVDDTLFIACAQNAAKPAGGASRSAIIRKFGAGHRYSERNEVKKNFDIEKIDYLPGYISCIFMIVVLIGTVIMFIRRIFDLLILYLVSPFFSASIALDGGAHFKRWKDMFIAQFFSGFGSIFAMKLYLLAAPVLMGSNRIEFSGQSSIDQYIKIFLVLGGAWSVYKGQGLFMQILNPEAAQGGNEASGAAKAIAAGGATRAVSGLAGVGRAIGQSYRAGKGGR
ncbi:MAG: hypothetical protein Q4F28_16015 [Eubacteriales bacterium]|nr:hypothetical protein [Eubacteriales bacterium]